MSIHVIDAPLDSKPSTTKVVDEPSNVVLSPTKLTRGLHTCQFKAGLPEGVEPTREAIDTMARLALKAGGISVLMLGWWIKTDGEQSTVVVPVTVTHKSGESLPAYSVSMPVDTRSGQSQSEAVSQALENLRRSVVGQLLNIDMNPTLAPAPIVEPVVEEPVQSVAPPVPQDPPVEKIEHPAPKVPTVVREAARDAVVMLKERFGYPDLDLAYQSATGKEDPWPQQPDALDFMAVTQLASACELATEPIANHQEFLDQSKLHQGTVGEPFFSQGCISSYGRRALVSVAAQ